MRGMLGAALLSAVVACNVLTGAASLETCPGDCTESPIPTQEAGTADAAPPLNLPDGALPATCSGDAIACEGRVAAQCVNGQWQKTPCVEACAAGKCDSWPSCRNAAGAGCGLSKTSCCATAAVPGGTFNRRSFGSLPATISKLDLDVYEVTVGRFRAFVEAGGGTRTMPPSDGAGAHPKIPNSGWQ